MLVSADQKTAMAAPQILLVANARHFTKPTTVFEQSPGPALKARLATRAISSSYLCALPEGLQHDLLMLWTCCRALCSHERGGDSCTAR